MVFESDGYRILGLAHPHNSVTTNRGREMYATSSTEYFARKPVVLWHNHHGPDLASTRDGSLRLYHARDGLRFEATPWDNPTTRMVLDGLLDERGVGVSVGYDQGGRVVKLRSGFFEIEKLIIREVSILVAACPCCSEWHPPKHGRTWCTLYMGRYRVATGSYGDLGQYAYV